MDEAHRAHAELIGYEITDVNEAKFCYDKAQRDSFVGEQQVILDNVHHNEAQRRYDEEFLDIQ